MRVKSIIAIMLFIVVAIPALAQVEGPPWDMRAYLSTYTDDAARSGTETYTWNFSAIRHRFVCPVCGYSMKHSDPDAVASDYTCPNPFGVTHPSADYPLTEATPRQRVLSRLGTSAQNIDGNEDLSLVGRPFHPGRDQFALVEWADPALDAPWEVPADRGDVASFLTARVGGDLTEVVTTDDFGLRFLVVEPGAVRAAASYHLLDTDDATTADEFFLPEDTTGADEYGIYLNPYRVSDGDVWYIRHSETNVAGGTTGVSVEVYSTLYGLNFDSNGGIDATAYDTNNGCRVITDDGAMVVDIPRRLAAEGTGTWVLKLVIDSNTQTLPRPQEVNYDLWGAEGLANIYDGQSEPAITPADFATTELSDLAGPKQPFYIATDRTLNPIIATADDNDNVDYPVAEKDGHNFNTTEAWPYRMPPEAGGRGRVMLQWSPRTAAGTPLLTEPMEIDGVTKTAYFRTGNEWHYLVDEATPGTQVVTNADTALNNPLPDDATFIDSYFMCSKLQVDHDIASDLYLGDDLWMNSLETDRTADLVRDVEAATGGYPYLILGTEQDPAGTPDAWGGEYAPGTRSPSREFTVANRTPIRVLECPVENDGCGTRYPLSDFPGYDPAAPPTCPVCGGAELVRVRAEAQVHYDGHDSLTAAVTEPAPVGPVVRQMTPEALRFGLSGAQVPIGSPDFLQEVFADIPAYQPASVPPVSADDYFTNDIDNDFGYSGTMVAFNRPADDGDAWDTNTAWDAFFLSPETGGKWATPEATMTDAQAQWVCSVCGAEYSRAVDFCRFCGHDFVDADDLPDPWVPYESLVAEEFSPFDVQVSVLREAGLAANEGVVDLGWVAPGTTGADAWPSDVSERSEMPLRNEGNILTWSRMRASSMLETSVEEAVRSYTRRAQTVPITLQTLFRYRPGPDEFGDTATWGLLNQEATGAAGLPATALLQAGIRAGAGEPYEGTIKPVPLGQPLGNYATDMLLYVDMNPNPGDRGHLDFYSPVHGVTSTEYQQFNPDIDEPLEPVVTFKTRARVVESRLPQSGLIAQDLTPTLLYDAFLGNLQALWVRQDVPATAGEPAPLNIVYANAAVTTDDGGVYRGWQWDDPTSATALTSSTTAIEGNTSPTAYLDDDGDRWAMWHRSLTTETGVSSRLQFATSTDTGWAPDLDNDYIFGSSDARGGLTGLVNEATGLHWQLWQAGPRDREHLNYRAEWDPTSGEVTGTERLRVSNSAAQERTGFFSVDVGTETWRFRKPGVNPFTYVKQPSAWSSINTDDEFLLDVVYTGHIRSLGNSDICWSRFNFGDPADVDNFPFDGAEDNFGKQPFPRVVGRPYNTDRNVPRDARGMPASRAADGAIRGYVGEQLEPSPRRQSYQGRDIDWLVTMEKPDPDDADNPFRFENKPDWSYWATDPVDPTDAAYRTYDDPRFYVAVVTDDGTTRRQLIYAVEWNRGSYDASTGLYTVMPKLVRMAGDGLHQLHDPVAADVAPVWHPYDDSTDSATYWRDINGVYSKALLAPSARDEALELAQWDPATDLEDIQRWAAVTLIVNPASGTVQWSSPLFNPDNPADRLAVFNTNNTENLVDVVMYADYTPFIRRVTTDRADDDSPSAFWDQGDGGRMSVFWRRSYGDADTPHFGRPSFLHRTYTRAIQVGSPAINSVTTVMDRTQLRDADGNAFRLDEELTAHDPASGIAPPASYILHSNDNGVLQIEPDPGTSIARIGHRIAVQYEGARGPRTEQHRVVGWSLETPVPINAVTSEGPVRVTPEVYTVDDFETVRYWLTWSSPRGIYDTRAEGDGGQRVRQSSDIYVAVVAPDHSSVIADLEVPRLEP